MAKTFQQIADEARKAVPEVSVDEVTRLIAGPDKPVLVDVREKEEYREGHLPGAVSLPRGFLEMQVEGKVPEKDARIVAYCQSGTRSLLAGKLLKDMGYTSVVSMNGGYGAWKNSGKPWEQDFKFTQDQMTRYSRHFLLSEVGEKGQAKLLQSKVLCLGAGGLGSPVAFYLAAAGVGRSGWSTTTSSISPTSSARSYTRTTVSGCRRPSPRR
jgi:rhodanese-related sulfurtransferase